MNQFQRQAFFIVSFFFLLFSDAVFAQSALLFQIPSSSNQIAAAQTMGDDKLVGEYVRSDNQIKHAIMKSFQAEFGYCPVYFFNASDYEQVKNKELDAVTFYAKDGKEVTIPSSIEDYRIANISFYPKETFEVKDAQTGETNIREGAENHFGTGIIIYNKNYKPIAGKMRFTPCKIFKRGSIFNKKNRYYDFKGAGTLNKRLAKYGWD